MIEVAKKSEKLATAIYLITSFFDDKEPMKWKLRELVSELVSLGLFLKDNFHKEKESASLKTRNLILEINSFLSTARDVGLITDANFNVIFQETSKYLDLLILPPGISIEGGNMGLSTSFFGQDTKIGSIEDRVKIDNSIREYENVALGQHISGLPKPRGDEDKGHNLKKFGTVSVKKNSRQSTIIAVLKRKKEVMIKDITPLIDGCSEKTIQRELLAMVSLGILKKTGEKRWSKYSLARL